MRFDCSLYLVTDRQILQGRDLLEAVAAAIRGGVTLLQIREKDVPAGEFYRLAVDMKKLADSCGVPLIVNDRLDVALAVDASGLHIGQDDLPLPVARRLLGPGKILGYSVSCVDEAVYGEQNGADYLGAGAVYHTASKEVAIPPIGVEGLRRIGQAVSIPVVGIGGISPDNAREVRRSGVAGISVISAILGSPDPGRAAGSLSAAWRQA